MDLIKREGASGKLGERKVETGELPLFFLAEDYFGKEDSNLHGGDGGKNVHDDVLLYEKYGCEDEDGNRPCYDFVPAGSLFQ